MKRLIRHKLAHILLLFLTLVPILTFPQPCYAWGAVTSTSFATAVISFLMNRSLTPAGTGADVNTHVRLMSTAYEFLAADPAWQDQQDHFPDIEGIKNWDRVFVYDVNSAMFIGGEWRWPWKNKGGPDAAGKTNDSEHYYNPVTDKGGAPAAVTKYYTTLIEQLHSSKDAKKDTIYVEQLNKAAAWSAHYLADMHVPYHVVGLPAVPWYQLTVEQAGPAYLWDPEKLELDSEGKVVESSIIQPADTWGQGGDFSAATSYFKLSVLPKDTVRHDWFDPWYNNGPKFGLSPNAVIAVSSHAKWETWANKQLVDRAALVKPLSYLTGPTGWKNVTPSFGMPQQNMDNQATQAEAFTIAAAKETRTRMASYLKSPSLGANQAIERIATLWRSSLTALRPDMEVKPDAGNPELLRVTATIKSVEPNDPATRVKARLTVEGGTIRGKEIHDTDESVKAILGKPVPVSPGTQVTVAPDKTVTVTPEKPWVTEWQVDSNNPDACKLKLEVICEYQKTPDLQYAVCTYARPLSVTVTPAQTEPGNKVTLTVRVSSPQQTELDIKIKPPQKDEVDLKDWGSLKMGRGKPSTDNNGEFKCEFTVKQGCDTGKYIISVKAPKLKQEGTASLNVGKMDLSWVRKFRFALALGSNKDKYTEKYTGISIDETYEGSFNGDTFTGTLLLRDEYTGKGSVKITVIPTEIPTYYKVTSFSMGVNVQKITKDTMYTRTDTISCTLGGEVPEGSREVPAGDKIPVNDYGAWMKCAFGGPEVSKYVRAVEVISRTQYPTGRTIVDGPHKPVYNDYCDISMGFAKD